jgi:hypothetical protein
MNNTIRLRAAENLQLGVLASAAADGGNPSREMICSIIDDMMIPARGFMVIEKHGRVMVYDTVSNKWVPTFYTLPLHNNQTGCRKIMQFDSNTLLLIDGIHTALVDILQCARFATRLVRGPGENTLRRPFYMKMPAGFHCDDSSSCVILDDGGMMIFNGYTTCLNRDQVHVMYCRHTAEWFTLSKSTAPQLDACFVAMYGGFVLVAGGAHSGSVDDSSMSFIFNVQTRRFKQTGNMKNARRWAAGCLLGDGRVFVCGYVSCEIFDPKTHEWTVSGFMKRVRRQHFCYLISETRIFIGGGLTLNAAHDPERHCEIYDIEKRASELAPKMPIELDCATVIPIYL